MFEGSGAIVVVVVVGASVVAASVVGDSVVGASVTTGTVVAGAAGSVTGGSVAGADDAGIAGVRATVSGDLAWTVVSEVVQPDMPSPTTRSPAAVSPRRLRCIRDQFIPVIESSVCRG